jgi:chemotaxis protein methyltransferase CheR
MMAAPAVESAQTREFPFNLKDFRKLAAFMHDRTGIVLGEHKMNMVYSRLARRLRELGISTFSDYCAYYSSDEGAHEVEYLINALTTNLTKFFREEHHFTHLRDTVIADAVARRQSRLRIWSAGCSTGEEPYTIGMLLAENAGQLPHCDARVLATDLDSSVVARGQAGIYAAASVADIDKARLLKHFERNGNGWKIKPEVRSLVTFKQLNLLTGWPMKGPFDAIFCRNVMIYFDNPTKARLVARFVDLLAPGGWLYIGHSETLLDPGPGLRLKGPTTYRKEG